MREVELWRDALAQAVAKRLGDDARLPKDYSGQLRLSGHEVGILALPDLPTAAFDMMIMDPASPFFGRRRFIAGVSTFGGDDILA